MSELPTTVIARRHTHNTWIAWLLNFDDDGRPTPGPDFRGAEVATDIGSLALVAATHYFKVAKEHEMTTKPRKGIKITDIDHIDALTLWGIYYG